jgi:hypothetical protein
MTHRRRWPNIDHREQAKIENAIRKLPIIEAARFCDRPIVTLARIAQAMEGEIKSTEKSTPGFTAEFNRE